MAAEPIQVPTKDIDSLHRTVMQLKQAVDKLQGTTSGGAVSPITSGQHGIQPGGGLHRVATTSAHGFMDRADKGKLDGIEEGATADLTADEIIALVEDTFQQLDDDLLSIASLTGDVDSFLYGTGTSTWALGTVTSFMRSALAAADAAAARAALGAAGISYIAVREQQTSGTGAGAAVTTTWTARVLNTVATNTVTGASLASNTVTLPAGTYLVSGSSPMIGTASMSHKARLYDTTNTAQLILGTNEFSDSSASGTSSRSFTNGLITLAGTTDVQLQYYASAPATLGVATISGDDEVYATLELFKIV